MEIREYKASDKRVVQHICCATASGAKYKKNSRLVCALYCDYYIEQEPENCFVLVDEFDKAVGYILCATDETAYSAAFKPYLKSVWKMSPAEAIAHISEARITRRLSEAYPAHMHIDILPAFRSKGGGRTLVERLIEHLKASHVKGLRLTVSASNKGAVAFYERMGFTRVKSILTTAYVYAMHIQD